MLNFDDYVWTKYRIGEWLKVDDPKTGQPAVRNPFLVRKSAPDAQSGSQDPSDEKSLFQDTSMQALQARKVQFLCCHTATEEQARALIKQYGLAQQPEEIVKDLLAHAVPGVLVVAAMVLPSLCCRAKGTIPMSRFSRHAGRDSKGMRIIRHAFISAAISGVIAISLFPQSAPPWSGGRNNPASDKGYVFQVPDVDNVPDLHGNPEDAKLVLFVGGNQFFVLPELISAFEKRHPDLRGRIFYETLPPGILLRQMESNNTITLGNFTLRIQPDVYEADFNVLADMERKTLVEKPRPYATNDLSIMVLASNPKQIHSLQDLDRPDVRLSMPNPEWEGIARQIGDSLRKAGGEPLFHTVYELKVQNGSTYLTQIHHRQTAMRIMKGESEAGVTWSSEVRFQEKIRNPIAGIGIPKDQNIAAVYGAAVLRNAPHPEAARAWVAFLNSPEAQAVYREYGFGPAK